MKSLWRTIAYAVAGALIVALLSSAATVLVMNRQAEDIITMTAEEYVDISNLLALNELAEDMEQMAYGGAPSRDILFQGAAQGMVDTLGTPMPNTIPQRNTKRIWPPSMGSILALAC